MGSGRVHGAPEDRHGGHDGRRDDSAVAGRAVAGRRAIRRDPVASRQALDAIPVVRRHNPDVHETSGRHASSARGRSSPRSPESTRSRDVAAERVHTVAAVAVSR